EKAGGNSRAIEKFQVYCTGEMMDWSMPAMIRSLSSAGKASGKINALGAEMRGNWRTLGLSETSGPRLLVTLVELALFVVVEEKPKEFSDSEATANWLPTRS